MLRRKKPPNISGGFSFSVFVIYSPSSKKRNLKYAVYLCYFNGFYSLWVARYVYIIVPKNKPPFRAIINISMFMNIVFLPTHSINNVSSNDP